MLPPERVLSGAAVGRAYQSDAYPLERARPDCVVLPESTEEVARVVRWCHERNVPFSPRGAGTGLSGGAVSLRGGVQICTKRMNRILEVDVANRLMRAEAGAVNLEMSHAVAEYKLHFAPDPSSQSVSTLGGNIAENSGGPHTLKYGVTSRHVLGVTLVNPEGEVIELGGRSVGEPGLDLTSIVVGSEGTLGVVTDAWVRLTPLPEATSTALVAFASVSDAALAVAEIIGHGLLPAALEMMDRGILHALRVAFGLSYHPETEALLLVECDGRAAECEADMAQVAQVCQACRCLEFVQAKDESERKRMWQARKKGIGAMGRLAPSIVTHDGVIPPSKLPEMLAFVAEVSARHEIGVANLFHAGDGNLHPCMYFDERDPRQVDAVIEAGQEIIARCIELGGSATGEHGIGIEKVPLMRLQFSEEDLRLQADVKKIFNPRNLCNPCKVLPDQKGCVEHVRRFRGAAH